MRWKVFIKGSGVFVGERKLAKTNLGGTDMTGFWLINIDKKLSTAVDFDCPMFIPWTSVLYVIEVV